MDKREIFYEGKHVLLKVPTEADLESSDWVGWFNDAELCRYNQHHYFPNTVERQRDYLRNAITPTKIQLGILDKQNPDRLCGFVSLQSIDFLHRRAEIAGFQDQRTTGDRPLLFWESWAIMIRHAFESLNLEKVYGGSFHPHVASSLKRMFGFEIEGVQRRHVYKDGAYRDVTLVAVFRDTIRYPEL
jgi:RimJ/RimL family protein N-acetyltransferase